MVISVGKKGRNAGVPRVSTSHYIGDTFGSLANFQTEKAQTFHIKFDRITVFLQYVFFHKYIGSIE